MVIKPTPVRHPLTSTRIAGNTYMDTDTQINECNFKMSLNAHERMKMKVANKCSRISWTTSFQIMTQGLIINYEYSTLA